MSFASLAQWWKENTDVKKPKDNLQLMNFEYTHILENAINRKSLNIYEEVPIMNIRHVSISYAL
jgi:hypothetical protein